MKKSKTGVCRHTKVPPDLFWTVAGKNAIFSVLLPPMFSFSSCIIDSYDENQGCSGIGVSNLELGKDLNIRKSELSEIFGQKGGKSENENLFEKTNVVYRRKF